ncbi:MAG TPA: carboxypeptidase regulatory-like domain-containing protein [Kofleriaceae bacterium]|nr:carboxypeptidase regulatory-like domain-containing protein [Kofleriaceae bacterium]
MKKSAMVVAIAVVLVLVFVIGRKQCGSKETTSTAPKPAATKQHATGLPASERKVAVAPWLAQLDIKPRKVAGKVVYEGKPVPGAIVRLGLPAAFDVLQPVAEVKTGADGSFDFGPQPGTRYNVSAEAPQRTAAQVWIEVGDPRAKPDQLLLVLGGCESRLFGSVLDASGGPVVKAHLRAAGLAGTETDAKGEYNLCVVSNFSAVRVEADGYGTINVGLRLFGELRYDFVLVPEAVLVGQVITDDKKPVAGARVLAIPDPSEGPHHIASGWAFTEDDGRFRIPGLSPGHYRVSAQAEGLASGAPVDAMVSAGTSAQEIVIIVGARARVSGRVMMGDRAIAGARVVASLGQLVSDVAHSQDDGSFVLQGVPFGQVSFGAFPYEVTAPKQLEVKSAKVDNVTLEVAAMASLHGIVTRKGKPSPDAELQGPQVPDPVKTDANGAYRIDGLAPGDVNFAAWSVGSKAFTDVHVKVAAGEDKQLDIELQYAGEVKGTVVDESGKPVPNVYVRLLNDEGDVGESMTNVRGEFDAGSMSGGEYLPSVYPSPMAGQPFQPVTGDHLDKITVPKDGVVTGIKLAVKAERFTISGNVVDDKGGPVADVHIEAIGSGKGGIDLPSIMSTGDGTFTIRNLARGMYTLHAHASDGSEADVLSVEAGAENVVVKMIRPGAIEGTLVGFTKPPMIQMLTLTSNLFIGGNPIVEGARFWQTGVRPGKYTVQAQAGSELGGESVEIRSGETAKVTITARGMGKVEGRVLEFGTKKPLAGFLCNSNLSLGGQMSGGPPDPARSSPSDEKGHFAMGAPVGTVRVFCFPQGGGGPLTVAGTDVEVTAAAVPNVEVYSVRRVSSSEGNAGFRLRPLVLPLVVNFVAPKSAAETQGMKVGDRLMSIDGASVQGLLPSPASTLIGNHKPGTTVTIGIDRGGQATIFKLPVTASPD